MKTAQPPVRANLLDALSRAPIFSALSAAQREQLLDASNVRHLSRDQVLWGGGARADHLGLLLVGRLKILSSRGRREVLLEVALPGSVLGEVAFTTSASYQSDVVALRSSQVLLVPAQAVRRLLEREPRAAAALALDLAGQVVRLMRVVEDLSAGSVERRLARVLLRFVDTVGEPFPGGTLIPLRLRRSDLAALAATTLESTSRQIAEWGRRGWVVAYRVGYLVRDAAALRLLAEQG